MGIGSVLGSVATPPTLSPAATEQDVSAVPGALLKGTWAAFLNRQSVHLQAQRGCSPATKYGGRLKSSIRARRRLSQISSHRRCVFTTSFLLSPLSPHLPWRLLLLRSFSSSSPSSSSSTPPPPPPASLGRAIMEVLMGHNSAGASGAQTRCH